MSLPSLQNYFRACEQLRVQPTETTLIASIAQQRIYLINKDKLVGQFIISTSRKPPSCTQDSLGTPWGLHCVCQKIGNDAPNGMIFKGRQATGQCYHELDSAEQAKHWITSRILRLQGLDPSCNQGSNQDSFARYIYIHGTNQEDQLGQPNSHGCLLLSNQDIIELYPQIPVGTLLWIEPPTLA